MNADSPLKLGVAARIGDEKNSPASVLDKDLPEVPEVPGISEAARRAARLAKYMGHDPKLCKLCVMEPKKGKCAWCQGCRNTVEAAYKNARAQDATLSEDEGTPKEDHIKSLEQAPDATRFRMEMPDFDEKTNPQGLQHMRGQGRPEYIFMRYDQY